MNLFYWQGWCWKSVGYVGQRYWALATTRSALWATNRPQINQSHSVHLVEFVPARHRVECLKGSFISTIPVDAHDTLILINLPLPRSGLSDRKASPQVWCGCRGSIWWLARMREEKPKQMLNGPNIWRLKTQLYQRRRLCSWVHRNKSYIR